jgi:hypothetical protein
MLILLCIGLPRASSTACDVKFSEGMRLIKCFCRLFSYSNGEYPGSARAMGMLYLFDDIIYSRIGFFQMRGKQLEEISL